MKRIRTWWDITLFPRVLSPWFRGFSGLRPGEPDVIHFEGATAAELEQAFRDNIDCYLAYCARRGRRPTSRTAAT